MKCHTCRRMLQPPFDYVGLGYATTNKWECPEGHITCLRDSEGKIIEYSLFWDADPDANDRYKMIGSDKGTYLLHSNRKSSLRSYKQVFETSSYVEIPLRDGCLHLDNLVMRLKKMGAFS